jgi:hypothetical protein
MNCATPSPPLLASIQTNGRIQLDAVFEAARAQWRQVKLERVQCQSIAGMTHCVC